MKKVPIEEVFKKLSKNTVPVSVEISEDEKSVKYISSHNEWCLLEECDALPEYVGHDGLLLEHTAHCLNNFQPLLEALKLLLEREWQDDDGDLALENARNMAKQAIETASFIEVPE